MNTPTFVIFAALLCLTSASQYCVFSSNYRAGQTQKCSEIAQYTYEYFDFAGMKGEDEHLQLLIDPEDGVASVEVHDLVNSQNDVFKASNIDVKNTGYVFAEKTTRYSYSGGGWLADPLLPIDKQVTMSTQYATQLYLTVHIPREIETGLYKGNVTLTINKDQYTIPISVDVWNLVLPEFKDSIMSTAMVMEKSSLQQQYPGQYDEIKFKYMDFMTSHRMPPARIYTSTPREYDEIEYISKTGAKFRSISQVSNLFGVGNCKYDEEYIQKTIELLKPTIANLTRDGTLEHHYVYGFDEREQAECEEGIRVLYGRLKEAFPGLKTMAVLNWEKMPLDLPVDIWVLQYQLYEKQVENIKAWTDAGKEFWMYHCIEPSGKEYLNSFNENPLLQPRLLFWYPMNKPVTGWLYYATVLFGPYPGIARKPYISRIGLTPYTNFPLANYIWSPRTDIFANGDGQWIYPDESAPVDSQRLCSLQDGLDDFELVRMIKDKAVVEKFIEPIIRSSTDYTSDPKLVEKTRREIAQYLQSL